MKREIKFRAWDGKLMNHNVSIIDGEAIRLGYAAHKWLEEAKAGTPMQYTGLKDKNGVEIYEDDIVHVIEVFSDRTEEWTNPVVWYGNGWCLFDPHDVGCPLDCFGEGVVSLSEIEVIGNICEQPHLLGGEQK